MLSPDIADQSIDGLETSSIMLSSTQIQQTEQLIDPKTTKSSKSKRSQTDSSGIDNLQQTLKKPSISKEPVSVEKSIPTDSEDEIFQQIKNRTKQSSPYRSSQPARKTATSKLDSDLESPAVEGLNKSLNCSSSGSSISLQQDRAPARKSMVPIQEADFQEHTELIEEAPSIASSRENVKSHRNLFQSVRTDERKPVSKYRAVSPSEDRIRPDRSQLQNETGKKPERSLVSFLPTAEYDRLNSEMSKATKKQKPQAPGPAVNKKTGNKFNSRGSSELTVKSKGELAKDLPAVQWKGKSGRNLAAEQARLSRVVEETGSRFKKITDSPTGANQDQDKRIFKSAASKVAALGKRDSEVDGETVWNLEQDESSIGKPIAPLRPKRANKSANRSKGMDGSMETTAESEPIGVIPKNITPSAVTKGPTAVVYDLKYYAVEAIRDLQITKYGEIQLFIKWQNYEEEDNTWEDISSLGLSLDNLDMLLTFQAKIQDQLESTTLRISNSELTKKSQIIDEFSGRPQTIISPILLSGKKFSKQDEKLFLSGLICKLAIRSFKLDMEELDGTDVSDQRDKLSEEIWSLRRRINKGVEGLIAEHLQIEAERSKKQGFLKQERKIIKKVTVIAPVKAMKSAQNSRTNSKSQEKQEISEPVVSTSKSKAKVKAKPIKQLAPQGKKAVPISKPIPPKKAPIQDMTDIDKPESGEESTPPRFRKRKEAVRKIVSKRTSAESKKRAVKAGLRKASTSKERKGAMVLPEKVKLHKKTGKRQLEDRSSPSVQSGVVATTRKVRPSVGSSSKPRNISAVQTRSRSKSIAREEVAPVIDRTKAGRKSVVNSVR